MTAIADYLSQLQYGKYSDISERLYTKWTSLNTDNSSSYINVVYSHDPASSFQNQLNVTYQKTGKQDERKLQAKRILELAESKLNKYMMRSSFKKWKTYIDEISESSIGASSPEVLYTDHMNIYQS